MLIFMIWNVTLLFSGLICGDENCRSLSKDSKYRHKFDSGDDCCIFNSELQQIWVR